MSLHIRLYAQLLTKTNQFFRCIEYFLVIRCSISSPSEVPSEILSEEPSEGLSERLSKEPNEGFSEGPSDGPSEELDSKLPPG